MLAQAVKIYQTATNTDPMTIDPKSREGRLLHDQMDAIVEVVDANQTTINAKGVGFKAFIPAVFARLVNEAFARRAGDERPPSKVTATGRPGAQSQSIARQVGARGHRVEVHDARLAEGQTVRGSGGSGRPPAVFRMMAPEYYVGVLSVVSW